ncbi:phospholipase D-like domain-containing protein [Planctomycetota bacterium]
MVRGIVHLARLAFLLGLVLTVNSAARADTAEAFFSPEDNFKKALVQTLLTAKRSVDIALYSFHPTSKRDEKNYAELLKRSEITPLDALRELADRGVRVRMVLNKAATDEWAKKSVQPLVDAGVGVFTVGATMHEKYAILDDSVVINGSGNWSAGAFIRYREDWVICPPDPALAAVFADNFQKLLAERKSVVIDKNGVPKVRPASQKSIGRSKPRRRKGAKQKPSSDVYFTTDNKGTETTIAEDVVVRQMAQAKKTLIIAIAHFNTDRIGKAVVAAHKRGVSIRVLVDLGEYGNKNSQVKRLQTAKVPLRYHLYSLKHFFPWAKLMHHKFMVVDGKTLLTGSYNWSRTAEHSNHENLQVFAGRRWQGLIGTYERKFEELWELGRAGYEKFMRRLTAKKGSSEYRRFIPVHFQSMSLADKEIKPIRKVAAKIGMFYHRGDPKMAPWLFRLYDLEKKQGTNEFPQPPHKPFFDLEQLLITEVSSEPESQGSGEFIELHNGSSAEIDLAGYRLTDGDAEDTLTAYGERATVVKPGGLALVVDPDFDGDFKIPRGVVVVTVGDKTLGNGLSRHDVVTLRAPNGRVLDSCPLEEKAARGTSFQRKNVQLYSTPDNWLVAVASPGKRDVGKKAPAAPGKPAAGPKPLFITEVCSEPENQRSGEFVELYNCSDAAIDLAGYLLADGDSEDALTGYGRRTTVLRPGRIALVIDPDFEDDFEIPRGVVVVTVGDATLGNGLSHGDVVTVKTPAGKKLDSCSLTAEVKKGSSVHRKGGLQASPPGKWRVAGASPGAHE